MFSLHQRQQQQQPLADPFLISPHQINTSQRSSPFFSTVGFFITLPSLITLVGIFYPWFGYSGSLFPSSGGSLSKWRDYTLAEAAAFVAKDDTIIVCAVSQPYLPFLNNWLISITRQKHQGKVLVIAEDYATLFKVNQKWPGQAVLIPPASDAQTAQKFGSQGFFNFTSRRPRHLLHILELGYNVMYNDVDMIWLKDPFPFFEGNHDVYFTDDLAMVDVYLLPQAAFPSGGLYFKNQSWVQETKGMHVIIHNNYITGFEKKIKRFREYGLWLLDDYVNESPLGRL